MPQCSSEKDAGGIEGRTDRRDDTGGSSLTEVTTSTRAVVLEAKGNTTRDKLVAELTKKMSKRSRKELGEHQDGNQREELKCKSGTFLNSTASTSILILHFIQPSAAMQSPPFHDARSP